MGAIHARLAHVGIYAHDKPLLERFYTTVLGLMVTDSGPARSGMELTFMSGNPGNHHQLVLVSGRPDTTWFNPIQQISFMVDSLADLAGGARPGAGKRGDRHACHDARQRPGPCYFKDPEGNTVEAYLDTPVPRAAAAWRAARSGPNPTMRSCARLRPRAERIPGS